jgi:Carboxypeptidase regulatory-like domain
MKSRLGHLVPAAFLSNNRYRCLQMRNQYGKNKSSARRRDFSGLVLGFIFLSLSATLPAQQIFAVQQIFDPATSETDLPNAPGRESPAPQSPSPQSTASLSGYVFDINGGIVPSAKVTVMDQSRLAERVETADDTGFFSFKNLPAGTYKIRITATDLEPYESYEITLHPRENRQLPIIALPIATSTENIQVTVTEEQIAEEQVSAQIQQRVFGVFPNFYTSFIWNAAPLKPKQKFRLAFRSAVDPVTFFTTSTLAGIQQARDTYSGYGQGAAGYAKRYGADYTDIFVGRMLGSAVFPSLFRQDPRYFYQGTGSISSRVWHALSSAFICRGDNGRRQFNYSHILGNFAAGGISNLYRPEDDRGVALAVDNALLHTATNAAGNLAREFALKNITTKIPAYAKGRPKPVTEPLQP